MYWSKEIKLNLCLLYSFIEIIYNGVILNKSINIIWLLTLNFCRFHRFWGQNSFIICVYSLWCIFIILTILLVLATNWSPEKKGKFQYNIKTFVKLIFLSLNKTGNPQINKISHNGYLLQHIISFEPYLHKKYHTFSNMIKNIFRI